MVVIFGFGAGKQEDLGETVQTVCPNCNNQVALHHVRSKKSVRLYFVPVVPYGTDDYLVCPICSRGHAAQPDATASYGPDEKGHGVVSRGQAQRGRLRRTGRAVLACDGGACHRPARDGRRSGRRRTCPAAPTTRARPSRSGAARWIGHRGPAPAAAADETSWLAQLRKLAQLHEEGVLSDAHYETAKRRILDQR